MKGNIILHIFTSFKKRINTSEWRTQWSEQRPKQLENCWLNKINNKRTQTFQSSVDEDGGEVVVAVHQIDVSRGEADCQQWFLAVH